MLGTVWKDETYGGHEVVVYEQGVETAAADSSDLRTIFGRVKCRGQWLPRAWTAMGRAFGSAKPHPLDLVPA